MDRVIRARRGERGLRSTWRPVVAAGLGCLSSSLAVLQGGPLIGQAITPCQSAAAPAAAFSASCASLSCNFTVTSSLPSNPMFAWDFGDSSSALGPSITMPHGYAAAGSYLVTLTVTDANGAVGMATVMVSLGAPQGPLAADDAFETNQGTPITIAVAELLANDAPGVSFVQADPAKCYVAPGASSCTYTPPSGFFGIDSFTYSVQDAVGNVGSATVWITVRRALVANPDYFTVPFDGSIQISATQLLANDTPGALFVSAQDALNGTLSLVNSGPPAVYNFAVSAGFAGDASFDYLISSDGNPPFERGIVTLTVVDAPPTANFAVACVNLTCTVHSTSTDPDNTPIYRWLWNWGDGTPTIEPTVPYPWADQTHTYAAAGRYTITLTVYDTANQSGSLQQEVLPNIAPVAVNDSATTQRDVPVTIDVLANDSDADGDPLTIYSVNMSAYPGAEYQVVQLANGRSAIKVFPPDAFVGTMTFTYVACDIWGACASPATVTLTVTQWTVVIDPLGDQFSCPQNGSLIIARATLLANAYDSNGDPLTIVSFDTSILMGALDCTTSPTVCSYQPPPGGAGFTLFRFTVSDPIGREATGTVRIYVGVRDQSPTAKDVFFTTIWDTPRAFTIQDIFPEAVDQDGDTVSIGLLSRKTDYGSLSCSTPMYAATYTPNPGYVGTDRFTYTASDMINPPAAATINVLTLPPTTPTFDAREGVIITSVNQPAFFTKAYLTSTAYAPSGGPVTVTAIDPTGLLGSLSCDATSCTYTPPLSFRGTTTFRYTASDGHGATDTAIVKVCVSCTNHPPVAKPQSLSTPKNTPLTFSVFQLMQNAYDPDNDPLTVTVFAVTAHLGTLSCTTPNYWCVYTPNANTTGADAVTYQLSDGTALVNSTVTINITP